MLNDVTSQALMTGVVTVLVTTITGLAGVGIALMRKKLGLQATQNELLTESNMRAKLQNTLVTAVGKYALGDKQGAVDYVLAQAGDAASYLGVGQSQQISDLIVSKAAAWAGVANPELPKTNG